MSLLDNFPHKCTVRKRTFTKDSLGARKSSYTDVYTDLVCWQQPAGDSESLAYQKSGMMITHVVFFRIDPGVTTRHQIVITQRLGTAISSSTPLDVMSSAMPDATAGLGVCYKVMCREITSEDD